MDPCPAKAVAEHDRTMRLAAKRVAVDGSVIGAFLSCSSVGRGVLREYVTDATNWGVHLCSILLKTMFNSGLVLLGIPVSLLLIAGMVGSLFLFVH